MNYKIILIICLASYFDLSGQTAGKIYYNETMKFQFQLDDSHASMMEGLPNEHSTKRVLYFNETASLFESDKADANKSKLEKQEEDGSRIVIDMQVPDDKVYCDLKSGKKIEQRDFMSRKFLIQTDQSTQHWKLTGNQKKILDYPCQEAVLQDTARQVTVWFTPAIPVSVGPIGYGNLPGAILETIMTKDNLTITATKVELTPIDENMLVKPKEGKKMSKEDYNKMVDEKTKEMMQENGLEGGNGNIIIKMRR